MGVFDPLVNFGKNFLPPPAVLFITHLLYAFACVVGYLLVNIIYDGGFVCHAKAGWILWAEIGFGVFLTFCVAFAKYKEKGCVAALIAFAAFGATIYGIQFMPFMCFRVNHIINAIVRIVICIPLVIIYAIWCKADLDEILPH